MRKWIKRYFVKSLWHIWCFTVKSRDQEKESKDIFTFSQYHCYINRHWVREISVSSSTFCSPNAHHLHLALIEWTYRANWNCSQIAAYPWWASRWVFYPPVERRKSVLWRRRRPCGARGVSAEACRSEWAGSGTGSSRTPRAHTGISPEDLLYAVRLKGRTHLHTNTDISQI